ncbi:MAG: hypothetical protein LBT16_06280 [Treponema sp.]|jgi:hypothetical protein|nr:hypothetical protein [Treponema sp.]
MKSTGLTLIVCLITGVSCATQDGHVERSGAVSSSSNSSISVSIAEEIEEKNDGEEKSHGKIQDAPNRFYYDTSYEFPYQGQYDEEKLPVRKEPAESGPLVDLPPDPASLPPRPPAVRRSAASSQSGDAWQPVPPVEPPAVTPQPSADPAPESAAGPPEAEPRQTATFRPPPPSPQRQPVSVTKGEPPRQRDRTATPSLPEIITVTVHPALPPVGDGKIYRLYVGSFKKEQWANRAFRDLYRQNLDPEIEREDSLFQVFIPGVYAEDIPLLAEKIAAAGFRDIWLYGDP